MTSFNVINNNVPFEIKMSDLNQETTVDKIKHIINASKVVVFMKGNAFFPQCGFSANTVKILNHFNLSFATFDILTDMEIRQTLKEYSRWPTYPQIYFNGELIGGNDILTEMAQNGDLEKLINESQK